MKKFALQNDPPTSKKVTEKFRSTLKNSCDSMRKSVKRNSKSRYNEKSTTSKQSDSRKATSKKKKNNFNNTIKLSGHEMKVPCDSFIGHVPMSSKYTMSINTNRHNHMSINLAPNNRSGAKCHMLSKISTPKSNTTGRKAPAEHKSHIVSPSTAKHSDPKSHFNFPGPAKARGKNKHASVADCEYNSKRGKNFKNMSGPIQFEKSGQMWKSNLSGLSHNSSSSKFGAKEKSGKLASASIRTSERHTSDTNKAGCGVKPHSGVSTVKGFNERLGSKQNHSRVQEDKDFGVADSSGGTNDNLEDGTTKKRMYGTEKIDIKKYNNLASQGPIVIDGMLEDNYSSVLKERKIEYPLQPGKALKLFMNNLTDYEKGEILDYKSIYFLALDAEKVHGSPLKDYNCGYDDERGDYNVIIGDHIAYRFEIVDFLGKGSFGQALKCFDHKRKNFIALKIIRSKKKFQYQATVEVKILRHLRENDPNDENNIIRLKDSFVFRKHI